jgi:hypothetical protein
MLRKKRGTTPGQHWKPGEATKRKQRSASGREITSGRTPDPCPQPFASARWRSDSTCPILQSVQFSSNPEVGDKRPGSTQPPVFTQTVRNRPPQSHAVAFRAPGWTPKTFRPPARYAPAHPPRRPYPPKEGSCCRFCRAGRRRGDRHEPLFAAAARKSSSRARKCSSEAGATLHKTTARLPARAAANAGVASGTVCSKTLH